MYDKLINCTYKYANILFHLHSNFTKLLALTFDFCLLQGKIHRALKYWKLILKNMKSHMTVKKELAKWLMAIHKPFCILAKKNKVENNSLVTWVSIWKWYWCPVDTAPCMTCGEFFIAANQEKENNISLRMNQNCISTLNLPPGKGKESRYWSLITEWTKVINLLGASK